MHARKTAGLTVLLILLTVWAAYAVGQKMMSVQVKKGEVRQRPSFLGKVIANLNYGDRVDVRQEQGAWMKIGIPSGAGEGWIHSSALTRKEIVLKAGAADVNRAATSDEIALAGKGFNKQVEGEFRAKNPNLSFRWVDKMETYTVSEDQIRDFIQAGGLKPQGGA